MVATAAAVMMSKTELIIMKKEGSNYWQVLKEETWKNDSSTLDMKN
jgi:hypothetical protein